MSPANIFPLFFCISLQMFFLLQVSIAANTITPTLSIKDGETITSPKEIFELGFFSPVDSDNRYLGIWFKKLLPRTYVWVANRNTPVTDFSGVLKFSGDGNLVIVNVTESIIWSSNASKVENPIAELLDTGNLIIREVGSNDTKGFLWQSFDYPTDTLLPGMKLGWDRKSGLNRFLTSWKSSENPSVGEYAYKIDRNGVPQGFLSNPEGPVYRTGSWNGARSTGVPQLNQAYLFYFQFVFTEDELFYSYSVKNESLISRLVLSKQGKLERHIWLDADQKWNMLWSFPKDDCDEYMVCGDYGICNVNVSSICNCMTGYGPKNSENWFLRDWSDGCIQETKYDCQKNDGFLKMQNMKLPDTSRSFFDREMSLKECEALCTRNCSCKAYSSLNITRGTGCITWVEEMKDLRQYASDGQDLYIRVADSELGSNGNKGETEKKESNSSSNRKKQIIPAVTLTVVPAVLLCGLIFGFIYKKKQRKGKERCTETRAFNERSHELPLFDMISTRDYSRESKEDVIELPLFNLRTIETATENFSNVNMLGHGGFGSVYKGTLEDGQKVAVKRLSKYSGQGLDEFKTEVLLIARLQHRNLVRLLGCCVEGEEKMLIYEHMQNKSLDSILFNKEKGLLLDWQKRIEIVAGIARGLLYLHQDSRLRIIHRDLKPSNILLDSDMNPKISDFGMARIFGTNQTEGNTLRVVGTYGYMSPEYAMDGLFSIKSDVYSFGVLVLEIISGKKNRGYTFSDNQSNLLGYAWTLWREGRSLELIDPLIRDSCQLGEALRCIQIGLLCVQERAEDRPTMSNIVLMLSSEVLTLPQPKYPGFGRVSSPSETESSPETQHLDSTNQMSVTMFGAR